MIAGWSHTRFGRREETLVDLVGEVVDAALAHAGVDPPQVDEIVVSHYNGGLQPLAFSSGLVAQANPTLRAVPAVRVENAASPHCSRRSRSLMSSGTANSGPRSAGSLRRRTPTEPATRWPTCNGRWMSTSARRRPPKTPSSPGRCAARTAHRSRTEPRLVVVPHARAPRPEQAVRFRGIGRAHDFLDRTRRDPLEFAGAETAWRAALDGAELRVDDLDLIELHDCFTIAELQLYEVLGLTPRGKGVSALDEGVVYPDGRLPVNRQGDSTPRAIRSAPPASPNTSTPHCN